MPMWGWYARYEEVLEDFGYSRAADYASARMLEKIIKKPVPVSALSGAIRGKTVIVAGAGPSISGALRFLKKTRRPIIAADSIAARLRRAKIFPKIITTDLDGGASELAAAASGGSIMVVHAHGDNAHLLGLAGCFARCIGTCQCRPPKRLHNFGGFTDGDRAVFLAEHFGAKNIVLFGMDLGSRIGAHSRTARADRAAKAAKLRRARALLEWLAPRSRSALYAARPTQIAGFEPIRPSELASIA